MKPAIIIKTTAGKRYLQIRTVNEELVHIGPTSDLKSWQIASLALADEYEGLLLAEKMALAPMIVEEKLDVETAITPIDRESAEWQTYLDKLNEKFEERQKIIIKLEKENPDVKVAQTPWEIKWAKRSRKQADP